MATDDENYLDGPKGDTTKLGLKTQSLDHHDPKRIGSRPGLSKDVHSRKSVSRCTKETLYPYLKVSTFGLE
jgi:hypothetical protein